jgi:hypothetical protein
MPRVGFDPTIPVFEPAKAVHTLYQDYRDWRTKELQYDNSATLKKHTFLP